MMLPHLRSRIAPPCVRHTSCAHSDAAKCMSGGKAVPGSAGVVNSQAAACRPAWDSDLVLSGGWCGRVRRWQGSPFRLSLAAVPVKGGEGAGCWCWVLGTGAGCNCRVCAHTFARRNVRRSTDHCFSMFRHATHTIVALDTAWPWASAAHGLAGSAHFFVRINYAREIIWRYRSTDRCFKHATKSIVALDAAWPWATHAYGLCCLRSCFCAHNFVRARSWSWVLVG